MSRLFIVVAVLVGLTLPTFAQTSKKRTPEEEKAVFLELLEIANDGDANAQFVVASRYLDGKTVQRDFKKAAEWYRKSAASRAEAEGSRTRRERVAPHPIESEARR